MARLLKAMDDLGRVVEGQGRVCDPSFIHLKVVPNEKKTIVRKIKNIGEDLQVALSLPVRSLIKTQGGYVSVDVPRKRRGKSYFWKTC
ncbi:MAG: hypothetical protein LBD04_11190 [Synergistaceae bacterium]|jgi:S-DNA-T family DNA segregation ATPase FtsK/SpoIIIE|nr:hypothetical protein [Synergistaceae bacterium]